MSRLAGQTVLISGASSGIGAACAELLAPLAVRLILMARRVAKLQAVADRCLAAGATSDNLLLIEWDVRQPFNLDQLPADWRSIDILINNAGLSRGLTKLPAGEVADWEEMIDTNIN